MAWMNQAALGRADALLVASAVAATITLWPTASSLVKYWSDIRDYEHGFLIAPIAFLWLVIVARRCHRAPARPSWPGVLLLAGTLCLWLASFSANSLMAQQLLLPAAIWFTMLAAVGMPVARGAALPIGFLYMAIPVWDVCLPVLQHMSIFASEHILGAMGVSAQVHANTVTIPEGTFQIIEGCSGKRYFVVALAIGVLAAAINRLPRRRFVTLVALSGALAIVANWIRIVIVIYSGHVTNMQSYFVRVEHHTLGDGIFVVLLAIVLLAGRRLALAARPAEPAFAPSSVTTAVPAWRVIIPFVLLAAVAAVVALRGHAGGESLRVGSWPLATGTWQGPLPAGEDWRPHFVQPDDQRLAAYRAQQATVFVYANVYSTQQQGRELVSYDNRLAAPGTWQRSWPEVTEQLRTQGPSLAAFQAHAPDGTLWLIAYTYRIGGWATDSDPMAQIGYGMRSLLWPVPAGVIALATECDTKCDAARALVTAFWDDMSSSVLALVPAAGQN